MLLRQKRVTNNRINPPGRIVEFLKLMNGGNYSKKLRGVLNSISEINANREKWEKRFTNERGEITGAQILTHRKTELEDEIKTVLVRLKLVPALYHISGWRTGYPYLGPEAGRRDSVLVRRLLDAAATDFSTECRNAHVANGSIVVLRNRSTTQRNVERKHSSQRKNGMSADGRRPANITDFTSQERSSRRNNVDLQAPKSLLVQVHV